MRGSIEVLPSVWKISLGMFLLPPPRSPNLRVAQIKAANSPSTTARLELTVIRGLEEPDVGFPSTLDASLGPEVGIRVGKARSVDCCGAVGVLFCAR